MSDDADAWAGLSGAQMNALKLEGVTLARDRLRKDNEALREITSQQEAELGRISAICLTQSKRVEELEAHLDPLVTRSWALHELEAKHAKLIEAAREMRRLQEAFREQEPYIRGLVKLLLTAEAAFDALLAAQEQPK